MGYAAVELTGSSTKVMNGQKIGQGPKVSPRRNGVCSQYLSVKGTYKFIGVIARRRR